MTFSGLKTIHSLYRMLPTSEADDMKNSLPRCGSEFFELFRFVLFDFPFDVFFVVHHFIENRTVFVNFDDAVCDRLNELVVMTREDHRTFERC